MVHYQGKEKTQWVSIMSKSALTGSLVIVGLLLAVAAPASDRAAQRHQADLDAACEESRERRLAPERERYIEECVVKEQRPDRAACERFYSDYGAKSGGRAPLYYDLPECVEAFEFRRQK